MGIIKCPVHGVQGFEEVCEHIDRALGEGTYLDGRCFLEVVSCVRCVEQHDLERFANLALGDWDTSAETTYAALHATSRVHCVECTAAAELHSARKSGRPDPFIAYESTLTFVQCEVVDRLRVALLDKFAFSPSIVQPPSPAVWVRQGAITCPLELTIYYVTDPLEQDAILGWLANFFVDIPLNQYRVRFYRSENWKQVPMSPPAICRFERGPEDLVREFWSNPPSPR